MKINSLKKFEIALSEEDKKALYKAQEVIDNLTKVMEKENFNTLRTPETSFSMDELDEISNSLFILENQALLLEENSENCIY